MAPNLDSGSYRIISLARNSPIGVTPTFPAFQFVSLDAIVQNRVVKKEGDTFQLSIGGYQSTGVNNDKLLVSVNPDDDKEWRATYSELQDAYIIELANEPGKGWVAPSDDLEDPEIMVRMLIAMPSYPPKYPENELFQFVPADD